MIERCSITSNARKIIEAAIGAYAAQVGLVRSTVIQ